MNARSPAPPLFRLVAIGGGTGLSMLLGGLKKRVAAEPAPPSPFSGPAISDLSAVVTVTDDGGSSGRLRRELRVLPPGDIRNCMVAMSEDEALMSQLFQYRFGRGRGLRGHSFGNLFLAALTRITGDFGEAVRLSSEVLAVRGRIFPSTSSNVTLRAELADGRTVSGETRIVRARGEIRRMVLVPATCRPLPVTLEAIARADIITLGPGSLYTSLIPNLLVRGIVQALAESPALKIFVSNLMTQPGETIGYTAAAHLRALQEHAGGSRLFDYAIVNTGDVSPSLSRKYGKQHAAPVLDDSDQIDAMGIRVVRANLVAERGYVRHDADRLANLILGVAHEQAGVSGRAM